MIKNEISKIWKWADLQIIGIALKSFLLKGKKVHNDIILSDSEESLNQSINLAYKSLCEYLCELYSKNPTDPDKTYRHTKGEKNKRKKGEFVKFSFVDDLQDRYIKEWGDNIENAFVLNSKENKTKEQKEAAAQNKEGVKTEKLKRIERINKRIEELIKEREKLKKEIEEYE